jgi:hypothetical protein
MKYESPITYHSKDMANDKVFADRQTDRQTNRRTGQKLNALDLSIRGHKKTSLQWLKKQNTLRNIIFSFTLTFAV